MFWQNSIHFKDNRILHTTQAVNTCYNTYHAFFLYKFYCNKNNISIVSFNLSEEYYSPVNSTHDYSPAGEQHFNHISRGFLYKEMCIRAITRHSLSRFQSLAVRQWLVQYNKTFIDQILGEEQVYCHSRHRLLLSAAPRAIVGSLVTINFLFPSFPDTNCIVYSFSIL